MAKIIQEGLKKHFMNLRDQNYKFLFRRLKKTPNFKGVKTSLSHFYNSS